MAQYTLVEVGTPQIAATQIGQFQERAGDASGLEIATVQGGGGKVHGAGVLIGQTQGCVDKCTDDEFRLSRNSEERHVEAWQGYLTFKARDNRVG